MTKSLKALLAQIVTMLTSKTGTFTKTQSASSSNVFVRQVGNVVVINGYLTSVTLTASTSTQIGTISNVSLPTGYIRTTCSVGANAYTIGTLSYIYVAPDGTVGVNSSNGGSGKAIYFNISYIA